MDRQGYSRDDADYIDVLSQLVQGRRGKSRYNRYLDAWLSSVEKIGRVTYEFEHAVQDLI